MESAATDQTSWLNKISLVTRFVSLLPFLFGLCSSVVFYDGSVLCCLVQLRALVKP